MPNGGLEGNFADWNAGWWLVPVHIMEEKELRIHGISDGGEVGEDRTGGVEVMVTSVADVKREREIPVAIWRPRNCFSFRPILFSPGYDKDPEKDSHAYIDYGYLGEALAERGWLFISVQHDLPADPRLPMAKPYRQSRLEDWKRGVADLLEVRRAMMARFPEADWARLVLAGHSNGGDMSAMAATLHPHLFPGLLTLDNRRHPLPRRPGVATIRCNDFPADPGVLPTDEERVRLGIVVERLPEVGHSQVGAPGTDAQHQMVAAMAVSILDSLP